MAKDKIPTGELTNVDVKFVSLVNKGANKRTFQIFKSADYAGEQTGELENDETKQAVGLLNVIKSFFTGDKTAIAKAEATATVEEPVTYAAVVAAAEAREGLWRVFDTISTVFWNIVRSNSDNKRKLLEQSLDEFKNVVLERFDKIDKPKAKISKAEMIELEKAGKKISASRLEALRSARDHLDKVITEAETAEATEETIQKEEEIDMNQTELTNLIKSAVGEAVKPLEDRLVALEKGDDGQEVDGDDTQNQQAEGELTPENIAKSVKEAVGAAVQSLDDRLAKIEKAYPMSNQPAGDGDQTTISKSDESSWGGLFSR